MKAVIFDFDGVIAESADVKTEAFRALFAEHPQEAEKLVEYHNANMGVSRLVKFRYFYEELLGLPYSDELGAELSRRFTDQVYTQVVRGPLVKGAREFLEEHYRSLPCFIATGTPEDEMRRIAEEMGLERFFREIHGSPRKKEDIVRDILERYDLSPKETLFVGDAPGDRHAAEANKIGFVARIMPYNRTLLGNCRYRIDDLTELSGVLRRIGEEGANAE